MSRILTPLAALVAALVTALVAVPATSASAEPGRLDDQSGWIRAGHLSPGTPKADIRLTPYAGGDSYDLRGVAYGDVTSYTKVPKGLYTVAITAAADGMDAEPMLTETVQVNGYTAYSVIATGDTGAVTAQVIQDDLSAPPAGQARIRLVSAATQPVTAEVVDGPVLAEDVATGGSTGYADVDAQTWQIELAGSASGPSALSRVPVEAGGVYTLLALDRQDGAGVRLEAVQDSSGSAEMPVGGADTGGGGLAADTGIATGWVFGAGGVLLGLALLVGRRLVRR